MINGGMFDDLTIRAQNADTIETVSFGFETLDILSSQASIYPATLALSALDGTNGFKISGTGTYDFSGNNVASASSPSVKTVLICQI